MQSVSFAVPTLATTGMAVADQKEMIFGQATAAIVATYLEHMNKAIDKGLYATATATASPAAFITQTQLVSLINAVQGALRS